MLAEDYDDDGCQGGSQVIPLDIITRHAEAPSKFVDVAHLQMEEDNQKSVFQVASNFNGVECISSYSTPEDRYFATDYIDDKTQGPAASISAGPGAITRIYAAFANKDTEEKHWSQKRDNQVKPNHLL